MKEEQTYTSQEDLKKAQHDTILKRIPVGAEATTVLVNFKFYFFLPFFYYLLIFFENVLFYIQKTFVVYVIITYITLSIFLPRLEL